jgi:hypothetical protein
MARKSKCRNPTGANGNKASPRRGEKAKQTKVTPAKEMASKEPKQTKLSFPATTPNIMIPTTPTQPPAKPITIPTTAITPEGRTGTQRLKHPTPPPTPEKKKGPQQENTTTNEDDTTGDSLKNTKESAGTLEQQETPQEKANTKKKTATKNKEDNMEIDEEEENNNKPTAAKPKDQNTKTVTIETNATDKKDITDDDKKRSDDEDNNTKPKEQSNKTVTIESKTDNANDDKKERDDEDNNKKQAATKTKAKPTKKATTKHNATKDNNSDDEDKQKHPKDQQQSHTKTYHSIRYNGMIEIPPSNKPFEEFIKLLKAYFQIIQDILGKDVHLAAWDKEQEQAFPPIKRHTKIPASRESLGIYLGTYVNPKTEGSKVYLNLRLVTLKTPLVPLTRFGMELADHFSSSKHRMSINRQPRACQAAKSECIGWMMYSCKGMNSATFIPALKKNLKIPNEVEVGIQYQTIANKNGKKPAFD